MNAELECIHCGLLNAPGSQKCDCGYDFVSGAKPDVEALRPTEGIKAYEVIASILIPVLGFALGIYALIRRRVTPALIMIGIAVVTALIHPMPLFILIGPVIERIAPAIPG